MNSPRQSEFDDDMDLLSSQAVASLPKVKVINDPIHGHFEIPPHVLAVVDTPHFQRLRDLKQLGGTYFTFPGASHNRFEHSLGVSYLSSNFIDSLYNCPRDPFAHAQYDSQRHFRRAKSLVELAGLVHDLGHGPFSHLFDNKFAPFVAQKKGIDLHSLPGHDHEDRSVALFEHCVETYNLEIEREHVNHVAQLIAGTLPTNSLIPKFTSRVVANAATGIDTDKFDYLARDVYNVGLQGAYGFDHGRLTKFAKVVGDDICFHRKDVFNVYHLFLTRFQLHRTVYNHRATLGIDAMICDAFIHADETLRISDTLSDPGEFLNLSDSILHLIERSKESALAQSRQIVHRLRRRKLYRFVDEVLMPAGMSIKPSPEEISTCQDVAGTGVNLTPDDIHVSPVTLHFGMKDKNPIDNVLFFKTWEDENPGHIDSSKFSYVIPPCFEEKWIRVYCKHEDDDDRRYTRAISVAFRNFIRRKHLGSQLNSPVLNKRPMSFYQGNGGHDFNAGDVPPNVFEAVGGDHSAKLARPFRL